jgi:hypothetical protein
VRLRIIRDNDRPATNPHNDAYVFGLQDSKQEVVAGVRRADGMLVFDFSLQVKPGPDPARPVFTGRFASGTPQDRFVYLSWRSVRRGVWINRVKARLGGIGWTLVRAAQAADKPLMADMSGRGPGHTRRQVEWRLGCGSDGPGAPRPS